MAERRGSVLPIAPDPDDRPLPHNLEAEKCVLGAALIDAAALDTLDGLLAPTDFYREAHARIFGAMLSLREDGAPLDFVSLKTALLKDGQLDFVGGPAYIASLVDGVPRSANIAYYAGVVREQAALRRVIHVAHRAIADAYDGHAPAAIADATAEQFADVVARQDPEAALSVPVWDHLLAGDPRTPLIDPWVARGEITLLHGQPRDGKSWLSLDFALSLASGCASLGHFPTSGEGRTLLVGNEDPARTIADRLNRLALGRGFATRPDGIFSLIHAGVNLDERHWQRQLEQEIRRQQIDLVVLDPMRSLSTRVDQGPAELAPLARYLRALVESTGIGLVCIHHDTKPQAGQPDTRRKAQRASGGGLFSIADNPVASEAIGRDQTLFTPDGFKHAEDPAPLLVVRAGTRHEPVTLTAEETTAATAEDLGAQQHIVDYLTNSGGGTGNAIAKAVRGRRDTILVQLGLLEAAGRVTHAEGPNRKKLWCLV